MWNIFLPIRHERLFVSCASSKRNHDCFLTFAHGHSPQRGEGRQHGSGSSSGGRAKKFAPVPRDRVLEASGRSQIAGAQEPGKLLAPAIVLCIKGVHSPVFLPETSALSLRFALPG